VFFGVLTERAAAEEAKRAPVITLKNLILIEYDVVDVDV